MSVKKFLNFLELLYKKKVKIPNDFLIDEIYNDSYFFIIFGRLYDIQNSIIWLKKGLFRETYSIKDFSFEPSIEYQSFKLTADLHMTRNKILFILKRSNFIKHLFDIISEALFIRFRLPILLNFPSRVLCSSTFKKGFQISKSCMISFGRKFPKICFTKITKFELFSQIYLANNKN